MTEPPLRITSFVLDIFTNLINGYDNNKAVTGWDLAKPPHGKHGTLRHTLRLGKLTPILMRLENHNWITSHWEPQRPEHQHRRRLYTINPDHTQTIRNFLTTREK